MVINIIFFEAVAGVWQVVFLFLVTENQYVFVSLFLSLLLGEESQRQALETRGGAGVRRSGPDEATGGTTDNEAPWRGVVPPCACIKVRI